MMASNPVPVITHLSTVHPELEIRIFGREARSLARRGFKVCLVSNGTTNDVVDGVHVYSLPPYSGRFHRMTVHAIRGLLATIRTKARVVHFHDPELIPVAMILKLMGKKIIYDVHENLPASIREKQWLPRWARWPTSRLAALAEWIAAGLFDRIVAATPAIATRFPAGKTTIIQNYPFTQELLSEDRQERVRPGRIVLAYVGTLTRERGANEMVAAMAEVPRRINAKLVIAGTIWPSTLCAEMARVPGWDRVQVLGHIDRKGVRLLLSQATAGLLLFHPLPNHIEAQPNKLFEYMSAELPIIASDFPLWRRIVGGAECGILVDPCSPLAIARAIEWIHDHPVQAREMGERGHRAVLEEFNWEREEKKLFGMYDELFAVD